MKPRIFISHSTNSDPAAREVLDRLCDYLGSEDQGYHVVVDKDLLKVGDHWRQKLLDGLGYCHGGVILLNQNALKSNFVHAEASILRWRNLMEKNFPLAIIRVGDVTPAIIDNHNEWKPLGFLELQILPSGGKKLSLENEDAIFADVSNLFVPLKDMLHQKNKTPLEKVFERVVYLLDNAKLPQDWLVDFLENERNICVKNASDATRLVTEVIMQEGIDGLGEFLDYVSKFIVRRNVAEIEDVIDSVAPMWVNPKDLATLFFVVKKDTSKRNCRINGKKAFFTPMTYIKQASFQDSSLGWKFIELNPNVDLRNFEMVLSEIDEALVEKVLYDLKRLRHSERSRERIKSRLLQYQKKERPIFISFPPELSDNEELINLIRSEYPTLTFFFLTNGDTKVVPVESTPLPKLDLEVEAQKDAQYADMKCDFCCIP